MKRLSRLKHHSDDVPKLIITKIFYLPVFLCGYQGRVEKKGKEQQKLAQPVQGRENEGAR